MSIKFRGDITKTVARNVGSFTNTPMIKRGKSSTVLSGNFTIPALAGNKFFSIVNGKLNVMRILDDGSYSDTPVGHLPNNPVGDEALNALIDDNTRPIDIKTFSSGTKALILCEGGSGHLGSLSIVSLVDNTLIKRIFVSTNKLTKIIVSPNGSWAAIHSQNGASNYTYMLLNLTTYAAKYVRNSFFVNDVIFSHDSTKVYAVGRSSNTQGYISQFIISTNTHTETSATDRPHFVIALNPSGNKAYVGNRGYSGNSTGSVSIYNLSSSAPALDSTTVWTYTAADSIGITPDGTKVLVVSKTENKVKLITTSNNVVSNIGTLPSEPNGYGSSIVKVLSNTKIITGNYTNDVSIIDLTNGATTNVVCGSNIGHVRNSIEITPDGSRALVSNGDSNKITSINLTNNQPTDITVRGNSSQGSIAIPTNSKALSIGGALNVIDLTSNTVTSSHNKMPLYLSSNITPQGTSTIINGYYVKSGETPVANSTLPALNVGSYELTKDGRLIVAYGGSLASNRNIFYIVDATTKDLLANLTMAASIRHFRVTEDSAKAVLALDNGTAVIVNLMNYTAGTAINCGAIPTLNGVVVPLSSSNKAVVYTTSSFTLLNLSANSGVNVSYTSLNAQSVSMSPNGTRMLVGSNNTTYVKLYDISGNTPSEIANFLSFSQGVGPNYVTCTRFTPDGTKMIIGNGSDGTNGTGIFVFGASSPYALLANRKNPSGSNPTEIGVTPDGSKAIIGYNSTSPPVILDLNTYRCTYEIFEGFTGVYSAAVTPDGMKAVILSNNGSSTAAISVLDLSAGFNSPSKTYGNILTSATIAGNPGFSNRISISPDGTKAIVRIYSSNGSELQTNNIRIVNLTAPYTITTLSAGVVLYNDNDAKFSPDGTKAVLMHGQNNTLVVVNLVGTPTISTKTGFSNATGYYGEFLDNNRYIFRYATGLCIFNFTTDQKTYIATMSGNSARFALTPDKTKLIQVNSAANGVEVISMASPHTITSYPNLVAGPNLDGSLSLQDTFMLSENKVLVRSTRGNLIFDVAEGTASFVLGSDEGYNQSVATYVPINGNFYIDGGFVGGGFYNKTTQKIHTRLDNFLTNTQSFKLNDVSFTSDGNVFFMPTTKGLMRLNLKQLPSYPGYGGNFFSQSMF